jgi:hypothetical protein
MAVKGALAVVKRITRAAEDLVAAAERELAEARAAIEQHRAEAQQLAADWLHAPSQDAAEQFDRQRREALRLIERDTARIPGLESRCLAAKTEKQRQGLARHRAAIVPTLVAAVEAAAAVQLEAIRLREAAVAELEGVVAGNIPHLAFNGILLPDLVQMWRHEVRRMFAPPTAAPPRPVAVPAPAKTSAPKSIAARPAPRPTRAKAGSTAGAPRPGRNPYVAQWRRAR